MQGTLLAALANVSVIVNNVVVKYMAPRSVATITCTRLATFTADLGDSALFEAGTCDTASMAPLPHTSFVSRPKWVWQTPALHTEKVNEHVLLDSIADF